MKLAFSDLRQKFVPRSTLGRVTAYVLALDVLLYAVAYVTGWLNLSFGPGLASWTPLLTFVSVILLLALALRWVRRRLMWRLRNRLIVTYVFIGVIPVVLLLAMAGIAAMIFGGQFAVLLATEDIETQLRAVESANSEVTTGLVTRLMRGEPVSLPSVEQSAGSEKRLPGRQVTVWWRGKAIVAPGPGAPLEPPAGATDEFRMLAADDGRLYLRAGRKVLLGNRGGLVVISSAPLNREMLNLAVGQVGEVTLSSVVADDTDQPGARVRKQGQNQPAVSFNIGGSTTSPDEQQVVVKGGAVPAARNRYDVEVAFPGLLPVVDWKGR